LSVTVTPGLGQVGGLPAEKPREKPHDPFQRRAFETGRSFDHPYSEAARAYPDKVPTDGLFEVWLPLMIVIGGGETD